jgi:hypothetical protein
MLNARNRRVVLLVAAAALVIIGCAKKPMWGDPETGLILTYRMPQDAALTYRHANEFEQTMEVMGQSMKVTADDMQLFTMTSAGAETDNLMLAVTIDSISMKISSPQGKIAPDLSALPGKSFEMVISPLGEEIEIAGADEIEYEMPGQGKRSIESSFLALFPDLPAGPVTVGDNWTSIDSIPDKSGGGETLIVFNQTHTLAGFETIHGMECAKIATEFTGKLHGVTTQGGMEFVSEAGIKGNDTWYFAYKEGRFVKSTASGTAEGTIKDTGGQGLNIPMSRQFKITLELVKM